MIPTLDLAASLRSFIEIPPTDEDPTEGTTRVPILHVVPKQFGAPHVIAGLAGGHPPTLAALILGSMDADEIGQFAEFALLNEVWVAEVPLDTDPDASPTPRQMAAEGDPRVANGAICLHVWNGGYRLLSVVESTDDSGAMTWVTRDGSSIPRSSAIEKLIEFGERLAP